MASWSRSPASPVARGLARARELAAALGVPATLHVAELAIRNGVRGVRVSGRRSTTPRSWWHAARGMTERGASKPLASSARQIEFDPRHRSTPASSASHSIGRDARARSDSPSTWSRPIEANRPPITHDRRRAGVGDARAMLEEATRGDRGPRARCLPLVAVDDAHRLDAECSTRSSAANARVVIAAAQPSCIAAARCGATAPRPRCAIDLAPLDARADDRAAARAARTGRVHRRARARALARSCTGSPPTPSRSCASCAPPGAIRRSPGGGWYLAADELVHVSRPRSSRSGSPSACSASSRPTCSASRASRRCSARASPRRRLDAIRIAIGYRGRRRSGCRARAPRSGRSS